MDFYQRTLFKILKLQGAFDSVLEELVKLVSAELDVSRVSVWRGSASAGGISCLALYDNISKNVERGVFLSAHLYPSYFSAINKTVCLSIEDAREDQRTSEFLNNYLLPLNICSMLDAPIIINGEVRGVICFEQVNHKRTWTNDELVFVAEIAQFVPNKSFKKSAELLKKNLRQLLKIALMLFIFLKQLEIKSKRS